MKQDTKYRLRDNEGKEYIIIDSEKVDLQEELNKTILKQDKEIERLHSIIREARELLVNKSLEDIGTGERYTHGKLNDYLEILDKGE